MPNLPTETQSQMIHYAEELLHNSQMVRFFKQEIHQHWPNAFSEGVEHSLYELYSHANELETPITQLMAEGHEVPADMLHHFTKLDGYFHNVETAVADKVAVEPMLSSLRDTERNGKAILDQVADRIKHGAQATVSELQQRAHAGVKYPSHILPNRQVEQLEHYLEGEDKLEYVVSGLHTIKLRTTNPELADAYDYSTQLHRMRDSLPAAERKTIKKYHAAVSKAVAQFERETHAEIVTQAHEKLGLTPPEAIEDLNPEKGASLWLKKISARASNIFKKAEATETKTAEKVESVATESHALATNNVQETISQELQSDAQHLTHETETLHVAEKEELLKPLTSDEPAKISDTPQAEKGPNFWQRARQKIKSLTSSKSSEYGEFPSLEGVDAPKDFNKKDAVKAVQEISKKSSTPLPADVKSTLILGAGGLAAGSAIASDHDQKSTESHRARLEGRKPESQKMAFENVAGVTLGATGVFWGLAMKLRDAGVFKGR